MDIQHDQDGQRFTVQLDQGGTAVLSYQKRDGILDFYSVFVPPQGRGGGVAAAIVRHGFEYARENNFRVQPTCPYVSGAFLKRYPEYQDLTV